MDLSEQVKEFRSLQKTHRIRVAEFCRERTLDYYEMVEALKKDKVLPELPKEEIEMSKVDNNWYYAEVEFKTEEDANNFEFPFPSLVLKEVTYDTAFKMKNYWKSSRIDKP